MKVLERTLSRLESCTQLDAAVAGLTGFAERTAGRDASRRLLDGSWLGHALHPALTDLPIGFWTSAFVLDLGGEQTADAADLCVALGTLSALPTVATGLVDWLGRGPGSKRVGIVHATSNIVATGLYGASWWQRRRGARARAVMLGFAGATAATIGGMLGGHLAFGHESAGPPLTGSSGTY